MITAGSTRGQELINEAAKKRRWINLGRTWCQKTGEGRMPLRIRFEADIIRITGNGEHSNVDLDVDRPVEDVIKAIDLRWPAQEPTGFRGEARRQHDEAKATADAAYAQLDATHTALSKACEHWKASMPGGYGAAGAAVALCAEAYANAVNAVDKVPGRFMRQATVEIPIFPYLAGTPQMAQTRQAVGTVRTWLRRYGITPPESWRVYADGEHMTHARWIDLDNLGV
jgi:hypothetical protein